MANDARPASGPTLRRALAAAGQKLLSAGVDDGLLDAGVLLAHVLGGDRLTLIRDGDRRLCDQETQAFAKLIAARAARQPVSRLLGRREFWSLDMQIGPAVLDPRPDSETIVAAALELLAQADGAYRIADLGTGSGCLLLALLQERPQSWGLGLDISMAAARQARDNAYALGLSGRVDFMVGDWSQSLAGRFDLIVANPPYIATAEIAGLAPEVRCHDPGLALDGGRDGLAAYRALLPDLPRLLRPNGKVALECGQGQAYALAQIIAASGLCVESRHRDLAGVERCFIVSAK
ncbi:MAG: peptide chain release factor N(5)-glutamine methyltransferase [Proteobacteria bacterium]|nr:peptide chain release factor N(5)-glutamine methyltransferase [Pseudomonadota bacterium]